MIKIGLKPSARISGSFVTLLITNNARNMSKSTSYTGQPVYSLVIKLLEKPHSTNLSQNTRGKRYVSV